MEPVELRRLFAERFLTLQKQHSLVATALTDLEPDLN
jgi:hypothetical protein